MSRLGGFSGRDVARVAEQVGWEYRRTVGSHMVYKKPGVSRNLSIPSTREVTAGTLRTLIDGMGLTVEQFLARVKE